MTVAMSPSTVGQRSQIGVQTTDGTGVTPTKRMPTLNLMPSPATEANKYRAQGNKFTSVLVPNKEWSTFQASGAFGFGEMPYFFSSLLAATAPVIVGSGPAYTWTSAPTDGIPDVPTLYTIEHGDDVVASKTIDNVFTDFSLEWSRSEVKVTGSGIGKATQTGITMTALSDITMVENQVLQPGKVAIYLDTSFPGLGGTKLTNVRSGKFDLSGRWGPDWIVDDDLSSYYRLVELEPKASLSLVLTRDSNAMTHFSQYRLGTVLYLRLKGTGPVITGGTTYLFYLDVPVQIAKLDQYKDDGGVYAIGFDLEPLSDPTAGFPVRATVVNQVATLA